METILGDDFSRLRRDRTSIKWTAYPPDVLPAWVAEMDARPCPAVVDAATAALSRGDTGYTTIRPYAEAMSAFAESRWGWSVEPERFLSVTDVMIGVLEAIHVTTDPGDVVVVSPPVYHSFFGFIEGYGRRVVTAPLDAQGRLDTAALDRAFGEATTGGRSAAYLLCNPQNPTGTVHTRAELTTLAALAEEHGVRVISDEIHAPLVLDELPFTPYLSVPGGEHGIAVLSASKAWNLAGLKCGLLVAGDAATDVVKAIPEVATHGASHVGAIAHAAALTDGLDWLDQLRSELRVNRDRIAARLAAELPGCRFQPGAATYLAWLDLRAAGYGDDPARRILQRSRVALSSGLTFGDEGRGYARLNFATAPSNLELILDGVVAAAPAS